MAANSHSLSFTCSFASSLLRCTPKPLLTWNHRTPIGPRPYFSQHSARYAFRQARRSSLRPNNPHREFLLRGLPSPFLSLTASQCGCPRTPLHPEHPCMSWESSDVPQSRLEDVNGSSTHPFLHPFLRLRSCLRDSPQPVSLPVRHQSAEKVVVSVQFLDPGSRLVLPTTSFTNSSGWRGTGLTRYARASHDGSSSPWTPRRDLAALAGLQTLCVWIPF